MKKRQDKPADAAELRRRAQVRLSEKQKSQRPELGNPRTAEDATRLVHELQVHQIELEMQNEELQQAHAKADALLAQYTDLYDFSPTGYLTLDRQGAIQQVNLTGARLLGVERSRLPNRRFSLFVADSERRAFSDFLRKVFASQAQERCEVTLPQGTSQPLLVQMAGVRSQDGQECRVVMVDLTERRRGEEERQALDAQLRQAQKMESVGRLAGGVAHDFNNALGVVLCRAELALKGLEPGDPLGRNLEAIREAALRSAHLTRQLLAFARKQAIEPRVLDLNEAAAGTLKMLRHLIGENINISWTPGVGLQPVKMDPVQVDQILANLLVNARDAIAGVGQIRVETRNVVLNQPRASRWGCVPGDYLLLSVADNGCGMEKDVLPQVFEPFFTTKPVGQGTGLGLATVYGIVKQNAGYIEVASAPGEGTTFELYLPSFAGQASEGDRATGAVEPAVRGETVLLVEDTPAMLAVEAEMLAELGYTVLSAGRPSQALALALAHPGTIHLLMTDVVMPEMNGRDLAERLRAARPQIRTLFVSGYTADIIGENGVLDEGMHFLQKPFARRDLASAVRRVIED